MLVIYVLGAKLTAILDAIFNISKRSMMPEWHQLDSSSTMSEKQESAKKKTLKSSSKSFQFSTGLVLSFVISHIDYFFTIELDKKYKLCFYGTCEGIKIQTEHFV